MGYVGVVPRHDSRNRPARCPTFRKRHGSAHDAAGRKRKPVCFRRHRVFSAPHRCYAHPAVDSKIRLMACSSGSSSSFRPPSAGSPPRCFPPQILRQPPPPSAASTFSRSHLFSCTKRDMRSPEYCPDFGSSGSMSVMESASFHGVFFPSNCGSMSCPSEAYVIRRPKLLFPPDCRGHCSSSAGRP